MKPTIFKLLLPCLAIGMANANPPTLQKAVYQPAAATAQRVNFNELAKACAPGVHHDTMQAIARVESGFNPYAIGVVKGALKRQPRTHAEAVAAAKMLHAQGRNFSMGLAQINKYNLPKYGLNYETVFDPCKNLNTGAQILTDCFNRAEGGKVSQSALQKAFSCYYSGNFRFGFTRDFAGQPSYVQKVVNSAAANSAATTVRVPAVDGRTPVAAAPAKGKTGRPMTATTNAEAPATAGVISTPAAAPAVPDRVPEQWDVFSEFI
ncbi:lytic transglycosylase domain-containing protein [Paralysiella testudinis]|uniref:Lytic transglycosylase domain-containing protein n=1 Tax=Paralysiella testudinis TaxID=2809020 RepID=A0A892ZMI0_9NEIS|nr:lytic transglycosylase domain-containing protein [Paralysiella testudinis]QRQ82824.1 lytic transglycosylase domain-containing protein [Paralysiella testudinis]